VTVNVGLRMKSRRLHPLLLSRAAQIAVVATVPVIGSPWVISGRLETKGVTSTPETVSMAPLEKAEDLRILYLLRYHMNTRMTAASSTRAAIELMTALATTPICDIFGCGVVIVVVLNWMSCTGILRMVSQL